MRLRLRFEVVLEKDERGYYARCPALAGLHIDGATEQEALENTKDAIVAYLESLEKHNDPIPVGCIVREDPPSLWDAVRSRLTRRPEPPITREILIAA